MSVHVVTVMCPYASQMSIRGCLSIFVMSVFYMAVKLCCSNFETFNFFFSWQGSPSGHIGTLGESVRTEMDTAHVLAPGLALTPTLTAWMCLVLAPTEK